jgi:predicted cupin superfamily sugar epimerase
VALDLAPHPEGGWFRRTWAAPPLSDGARPTATGILFLLAPGERSAPHVVDADELWLWHGPGSLVLRVGPERVVLDADRPQVLVPAGVEQSTEPAVDEVLVSCVVSPGFEWSGFRML